MKTLIFILISVFPLLGLAQTEKSLVGKYESEGSNLPLGYDWFMGNSYAGGVKLSLNADGTFRYQSCTILTGGWETKNDSLFLYADSHKWRNDSLNRVGYYGKFLEAPEEPLKFQITKKGFRNNRLFDYKGESYNAINKLVRKKDQ